MMSSLIALATAQATSPPPPPMIMTVPPAPPIMVVPSPPPVFVPVPPMPTPPPPAPPSGVAATPARQVSGAISSDDYPAAAIRAGHEGSTHVRLTIGTNGRIADCSVIGSSGSLILDSATCQLMTRRFRYRPATRDGVPVEGAVTQRVTWRFPEEPIVRFAQGRFTWTVAASPAGTTDCTLTLVGETFREFDEGNCRVTADAWLVDEEVLEPGHPPVRVTQILSLLPQGETLTLPRLPGTPFWEEVAEIEIGPDGRVTACTPASQTGELPDYVNGQIQPLCEGLAFGRRFTSSEDGAVRRARMQSALYVEVEEPRRR